VEQEPGEQRVHAVLLVAQPMMWWPAAIKGTVVVLQRVL
jgi:hypothetical protein